MDQNHKKQYLAIDIYENVKVGTPEDITKWMDVEGLQSQDVDLYEVGKQVYLRLDVEHNQSCIS